MDLVLGFWVLMVVLTGWCWQKKKKKKEERENKGSKIPKGNTGWPLIGETLDFIASGYTSRPVSFMDKRNSLYGKVFKTHILGRPVIVSTDPEVNRVVLLNHGNTFVPWYPKSITELLGKSSILQMNGSLHKRVHSLISCFLKSPQLKARITREIENSVKLSLSTWQNKHLVYLQDEAKQITFEVLVRVLMSVGPGEDLEFLKRQFGEFIKGLICLPFNFPGSRLYKSLKAKERLLKMVRKIVEERKLSIEKTGEKGFANDTLDVLLRDTGDSDDKQRLSFDFISGNIVEMMIPGEDSVPMVITLAIKFLSDYPVILKQLVDESLELKKQKAYLGNNYDWTDYMSLRLMQNVISETLRIANIINAVWRKALRDVEIKDYLIPKGWCILASLSSVHLNEENYENPYHFDPWRWEKIGAVANHIFTPFGGGQRLCPGLELGRLEISIVLFHFITTYRWEAKKDEIIYFPTVKMKKKLPITVTPMSS